MYVSSYGDTKLNDDKLYVIGFTGIQNLFVEPLRTIPGLFNMISIVYYLAIVFCFVYTPTRSNNLWNPSLFVSTNVLA